MRKLSGLGQKKAHLIEVQVNGGASVSDKVDFATKLFEKVRGRGRGFGTRLHCPTDG